MNIHVVLMLLAFHSPVPIDDVPLLTQEQISAPTTMHEEKALLWHIRAYGEGQ